MRSKREVAICFAIIVISAGALLWIWGWSDHPITKGTVIIISIFVVLLAAGVYRLTDR